MIISASRRTDIPAFYGRWFARRLEAGFCQVPNPFNPKQVATVSLRREDVDAFVFWTRFPKPFMPVLDQLERRGFPSLFLVTLTGYGPPLEPCAPSVDEAVVAMKALSERVGPERVVWRYDPIVLGPGLDFATHLERFRMIGSRLRGATDAVKISFVDLYRKTRRRLSHVNESFCVDPIEVPEVGDLVAGLRRIAEDQGMSVETCAEEVDFSAQGVAAGSCIDGDRLSRLIGRRVDGRKDPGQRDWCRCARSRDIGMNDTCLHGCVYCYATSSHQAAVRRHARHDPLGPSLLPLAGT